jgi:hypothetical protein
MTRRRPSRCIEPARARTQRLRTILGATLAAPRAPNMGRRSPARRGLRAGEGGSLVTHLLPLVTDFLIGTPRLEFPTTQTKQSADPISNRGRLGYFRAVFLPWWTRFSHSGRSAGTLITDHSPHLTEFLIANPELEFRLSPSKHTHLRISNREYIAVFQSAFFRPVRPAPLVSSSIVSLAAYFLIYGAAIRIPRKLLKT